MIRTYPSNIYNHKIKVFIDKYLLPHLLPTFARLRHKQPLNQKPISSCRTMHKSNDYQIRSCGVRQVAQRLLRNQKNLYCRKIHWRA